MFDGGFFASAEDQSSPDTDGSFEENPDNTDRWFYRPHKRFSARQKEKAAGQAKISSYSLVKQFSIKNSTTAFWTFRVNLAIISILK